jgi:aspartokinase
MGETKIAAGGVLHSSRLCLVGVMSAPDQKGLIAAIFRELSREGLNAEFIVQSIDLNNESHVQFCVDAGDSAEVVAAMQEIATTLGVRKVMVVENVALISVYGPDFRHRPGIAGLAFESLAKVDVNILATSTSISTVSCVIAETDYETALGAWQDVFALG